MKKLILSLIMFLMFPLFVFADAAAPMIRQYEARITNKNGIIVSDFDPNYGNVKKKIPYDTVITVQMEEIINGVIYAEFTVEYEGEYYSGRISKSDYQILDEKLIPNDSDKASGELFVYKEGAYLYNGPSFAYDKATNVMIPVGTELKYEYKDSFFAYVTYNGVKGWIYTAEEGPVYNIVPFVAFKRVQKLHTFKSINILSEPNNNGKTIGTIPDDKDIDTMYIQYEFSEGLSTKNYYYIEYNGVKGWVKFTDGVGIQNKAMFFKPNENTKVCTNYDFTNYECLKTIVIPKNTILYSDYELRHEYTPYFRFSYNGTYFYGELFADDDYVSVSELAYYQLKTKVDLYDKYLGNTTGQKQNEGIIEAYYITYDENDNSWFYIPSNDTWIKTDYNNVIFLQSVDESNGIVPGLNDVNTSEDKPAEPIKIDNIPTKTIIIYSIICSLALVFIVVVIIELVNNNKTTKTDKNKNVEKNND